MYEFGGRNKHSIHNIVVWPSRLLFQIVGQRSVFIYGVVIVFYNLHQFWVWFLHMLLFLRIKAIMLV